MIDKLQKIARACNNASNRRTNAQAVLSMVGVLIRVEHRAHSNHGNFRRAEMVLPWAELDQSAGLDVEAAVARLVKDAKDG